MEQGADGEVVWYVSAMTGPLVEEGEARTIALREAAFDHDVEWRKYYSEAECVGEEMIDGKSCHKIVLIPAEGPPETRYYDKASNLLVRTKKTRLSSHMGSVPVESTYSDYRRVDGLLIAHIKKQASEQCGSTREIVFVTESIEHNVDLRPDRFDPPPKVRALAVADKITGLANETLLGDDTGKVTQGRGGCAKTNKTVAQKDTTAGG